MRLKTAAYLASWIYLLGKLRVSVLHPDIPKSENRRLPEHSLEEAVSLANALELDIVHSAVVPLRSPKVGLLFGKGKLEETKALFENLLCC